LSKSQNNHISKRAVIKPAFSYQRSA